MHLQLQRYQHLQIQRYQHLQIQRYHQTTAAQRSLTHTGFWDANHLSTSANHSVTVNNPHAKTNEWPLCLPHKLTHSNGANDQQEDLEQNLQKS